MPTCPRCAVLAVAIAALAFTGCDTNNPGRDLALIEGTYTVAEITFRPDATGIDDVDVNAGLDPVQTELRIFGDDRLALFEIKPSGSPSRRVDLEVSASRGRATFEAPTQDDVEDLQRILLPAQFALSYDEETGTRLNGSVRRTANLQAFDSSRYTGLTAVPGQLTIRFERP